ncbi:hypothetical protein TWF481_008425 [Arthrobotrys musiformis]|uniref:Uncharacterized protein n=1 Tax=Arthrobotrys musiformis TaxID=47236 RepID=A0AAV9W855_9PEZI
MGVQAIEATSTSVSTSISTSTPTATRPIPGMNALDVKAFPKKPKVAKSIQKEEENQQIAADKINGQKAQTPHSEGVTSRAGSKELYLADLRVVCNSARDTLLTTPEKYTKADELGLIDPEREFPIATYGRDAILDYILSKAFKCAECDCETLTEDGPRPNEDNTQVWSLVPNPLSQSCNTDEAANICEIIYGCKCEEFIALGADDPDRRTGGVLYMNYGRMYKGYRGKYLKGSREDYAYKLEHGLPLSRMINRPTNQRLHEILEQAEYSNYMAPRPSSRQLVPGTKEPYYLTGPNEDEDSVMDTIARLRALDSEYRPFLPNAALFGVGSSLWKRELKSPDQVDYNHSSERSNEPVSGNIPNT